MVQLGLELLAGYAEVDKNLGRGEMRPLPLKDVYPEFGLEVSPFEVSVLAELAKADPDRFLHGVRKGLYKPAVVEVVLAEKG
jgi:hypothetical protein